MKRDSKDEDTLLTVLQRFGLFSAELPQMDAFVEERLMPSEEKRVTFRDKLTQNKYLILASLYEVQQSDPKTGKAKTVKADINVLQRLIAAYEAGYPVNLDNMLTHKLFVVPLSLAGVDGQILSGSKAILAKFLTADIPMDLKDRHLQDEPMLVIDGQALVIAIGKPQAAKTF